MPEAFLVRTEGGPCAGEVRVANASGDEGWTWPLPGILKHPEGRYVKVSESDLGPRPEGSRLLRGAVYEWEEASGG